MKTYTDQTEFTDQEKGTKGNCLSACLANLLNIELSVIPNFAYLENKWYHAFDKFLTENGFECNGSYYFDRISEQHPLSTWEGLMERNQGVGGVFIAGGPSPRFPTIGHAVLYKDGSMIHDPHPSRLGLVDLKYVFLIEKSNSN